MAEQEFSGKVAIVSAGGAGIGRATAIQLAECGAAVVVADLSPANADATVHAIRDSGGSAIPFVMDLGQSEDAQRTVDAAIEAFGRLDILVNCAAILGSLKPILETTKSDWEKVLHTNVIGTVLLTQASVRQMLAQHGGGAIVNILAIQALMPLPAHGPYAASRGALSSFTRSLAVELASEGIRVNGIAVGSIYTDSARNALEKPGDNYKEMADVPEEIDDGAATLVGRMGRPEEIANVAVFLASERASYLAGAIIPAEGGRLISRKPDPFLIAQQIRNASRDSGNSK